MIRRACVPTSFAQDCCLHYTISTHIRPYLLKHASAIAHHRTPEMILRGVIFSTPKSGKFQAQLNVKCTPKYLDKCRQF